MASDEQILTDTLKLMASTGEVIPGLNGLWYLQINSLPRIFRPLSDPKMGGRLWVIKNLAAQDATRAYVQGLPVMTDAQKNEITAASEHLEKTGEVREELL